jgi:hypothetical protein
MVRFSVSMVLCVSVSLLVLPVGCGPQGQDPAGDVDGQDNYRPHDVPITEEQKAQLREETSQFADAVAKIKEFRVAIEEETKDGIPENPYKAHQALDKVDLVLKWLPEIASESGVAKEHWEPINTTANDLRDLFDKVHQNIDKQQDPDFAGVAADVDQKIAELEAVP